MKNKKTIILVIFITGLFLFFLLSRQIMSLQKTAHSKIYYFLKAGRRLWYCRRQAKPHYKMNLL